MPLATLRTRGTSTGSFWSARYTDPPQRLIRLLALIPRPSQLNDRPLQHFSDRLKAPRDQTLVRLDPAIQILYQFGSSWVRLTDSHRPFDTLSSCC